MQGLLRSELYTEAIVVFVKAFATSPFCLEPLEEVTEKLVYALNLVLHNHMRKYGHRPMPNVWCVILQIYCTKLLYSDKEKKRKNDAVRQFYIVACECPVSCDTRKSPSSSQAVMVASHNSTVH